MTVLDLAQLIDAVRPIPHEVIDEGPWWEAWNFDLQVLIPLGLLAGFYLRGLGRWPARSRSHPAWRTALFLLGVVLLGLATESPIDRLGEHAFTMHMVQHEMVMMWAVPFILLGAPTTPVLRGLPRMVRRGVVRPLARQQWMRWVYRSLTHPVFAAALFSASLWLWHLAPGWYDAALEDDVIHDVQHLSFLFVATLFWWNVIDPAPLHSRIPHLPRVLYIFAAGVPKHFLGAMLTFSDTVLYKTYLDVRQILPLTPIEDQQAGALIMWVPSVMMMLIAMGITFFVWLRVAEREQREAEALADEERVAPAAT